MSREDYSIMEDDLLPVIYAQFKDRNGPMDLSGASAITFHMRSRASGANKVSYTASTADATDGEVYYAWRGTDTDTPGLFNASFQATINSKTVHTSVKLIRIVEKLT